MIAWIHQLFHHLYLTLLIWADEIPLRLVILTSIWVPICQALLLGGAAALIRYVSARKGDHIRIPSIRFAKALWTSGSFSYAAQTILAVVVLVAALNWNLHPTEIQVLRLAHNYDPYIVIAIFGEVALLAVFILSRRASTSPVFTFPPLWPAQSRFFSLLLVTLTSFIAMIVVRNYVSIGHSSTLVPDAVSTTEIHVNKWMLALWLVWTATAVPVVEEYFFRGLLQSVVRAIYGPYAAIGLQALLFTAMHTTMDDALYMLVVGLSLGALCEATKSLVSPIALHSVINITAFI